MYQEQLKDNYFFDLKPNTNIYRYTTTDRLFQLFEEKQLVLVKPFLWDDPFENILSKVIYYNGEENVSLQKITDTYYGQCWTKSMECDGLWRNYTNMEKKECDGVKITTQTQKLFKEVSNCDNDNFCGVNTFIGNVKYDTDKKIIGFFKSIKKKWIMDSSGKNPSKTLFLKRNEFKYENEVRIIKSVEQNTKAEAELLKVDINPLELITSIVFSPMMDDKIYKQHKNRLINLGYEESKISKSKLYAPFSENIYIPPKFDFSF